MYTFYCLLRRMKGLFFLRQQMYTFGRALKNKIKLFSVARNFPGYTGKYIVYLSRTEEPPAWMGTLLNKNLKCRTYKFAWVLLPRLVEGFFTNLALKHFGSVFELPYQLNGTKTREYDWVRHCPLTAIILLFLRKKQVGRHLESKTVWKLLDRCSYSCRIFIKL